MKDPDEPGIPGVTVELLDADGNVIDSTTTDADGDYRFSDVPFGDYSVRVLGSTAPPGYRPSYDPDGVLDQVAQVSVGFGENVTDINFGYETVAATQPRAHPGPGRHADLAGLDRRGSPLSGGSPSPRSAQSLTSTLPRLAPVKRRSMAAGAWSRPSTTSTR